MSIVFADIDAAMAATELPGLLYCRIGGVAVAATEAHCRHAVDRPIGSCTVYVQTPRPASAAMNATIEIEMGYPGATRRTFYGVIPSDESVTDERGGLVRIEGQGWASRLTYPEPGGIELAGPISLKETFRSLCALRSIPTYLTDDTTYIDGSTTIMLGGNSSIDGGNIRIDDSTAPLAWLTDTARLFGYRVFDCPDGTVRLKRISGLPASAGYTYAEGVNVFRLRRNRDTGPQVNYWEVLGARYTAADGGPVQIRSIPASVPYAPELDPPGYRKDRVSSQSLVTDTQAAGCRNVMEIDYSEVTDTVSWDYAGRPDMQPGEVASVTGASHGLSASLLWLTGIDQAVTDRGYLATMDGWSGAGQALAAGNDCVTVAVPIAGDGCIHVGDQTLGHYKDPTPDSNDHNDDEEMRVALAFTISYADSSSVRLAGYTHGSNSINTSTAVEGSKVEIWQLADPSLPESATNEVRRVSSLDLPTANEELHRRRNYAASNTYWQSFALPVNGTLKQGAAEMRFIAAKLEDGGHDDYEIKDVFLTYCGVGVPTLPGSL